MMSLSNEDDFEEAIYFENESDLRNKQSTRLSSDGSSREESLSPSDLKDLIERLTREDSESKEIKHSVVRKLTADMTERGRKIGAHLESIHGYAVKEYTNIEDSHDQGLSDELADELRKRTTSVDSEIKQLENQMGQLQRTLVKGKARRESLRHRMSVTSPGAGRKVSAISSCSSTSEADELSFEDYKAKIESLENEKLDWAEEKRDLGDEIKFLKYQLQYRLDVQSLQNNNADKSESEKLVKENDFLKEENNDLKKRLSTVNEKLKDKGTVYEDLIAMTDLSNDLANGVTSESEIERLHSERKILLSTIMRMQSIDKEDDYSPSFADFGVQVDLNSIDVIEEDDTATPLVAKLTKENKALKKHITEMQKDLDEYEEERKTISEENFKLIDEKRSLEDTINKLRTQMSESLDTTLDEIEHLHDFNEDLEAKFKQTQSKLKEMYHSFIELQENNCKSLEKLLDESEKIASDEVFDYLDSEVGKLFEYNKTKTFQLEDAQISQRTKDEKQFSSNLLSEVKSCKDLLESQSSHIRKLQLDKRDIEEGYTKMKRELLLLKSSKQRARENSKELQFLKKRRAKSLNDGALEAKTVLIDKDSLQREVKRLGSMKTELENTVQKLKKDKTTLEDEKVCLLGSLYHQLERNESLEMQIEELTAALQVWEAKSDLENDVFGENPEQNEENNNQIVSDDSKPKDILQLEIEADASKGLEVEQVRERPKSPVMVAAEESMHEMKEKIHALSDQLKAVQESVIDLETERDKLLEDLEESKKNEKELRNVIVQLKRENSIYEDRFTKSNETAETLQIRLKELQAVKEEADESLVEAKAEKEVAKKHCEVLDNRLKEVTTQRDQYKDKTDQLNECLKELYGYITEMVQTDDEVEMQADEALMSQDELQTGIYNGLAAFQTSITDVMKQLNEKNDKITTLNGQLDASNSEKEALLKSLRESDAKKKQLKGFITKLTEEKEKITEQLDEMKQQKSNLADALENVYQSKEKLQNRLSEALCKQEKHKKTMAESVEEAKALRESLYRMVHEHETMKESLLNANREVELLKNKNRNPNAPEPINVITEEDEIENNAHDDPNDIEITNNNAEDKVQVVETSDFLEMIQALKKLMQVLRNGLDQILNGHFVNNEITPGEEKEGGEGASILPIDKNVALLKKQIDELDECLENAAPKWQHLKKIDDNDDIAGLVDFQADILTRKLDLKSSETQESEDILEKLKSLSIEKESVERELENATSDNIRLLEDLAFLRKEKVEIEEQLQNYVKKPETELVMTKEENLALQESTPLTDDAPQNKHEHEDAIGGDQSPKQLDTQLKDLIKNLQNQNEDLKSKVKELAEKHLNFNAIEIELEKSNNETKALEKQVEVLSKEGATLRGDADERVQRLIELEENMIVTIEKKLELAEYASILTSKKDVLEKKCEELSNEVQGLKQSRDQILMLKSQSDEKMHIELTSLRDFKEKAVKEIEDLNDILRIGRQDFEAMKIELDSMQRKNRSLKQELEKVSPKEDAEDHLPSIDIQLMKLKILKLEDEIISTNEKFALVEKERNEELGLLNQLLRVVETPEKEDENHLRYKVEQLEKWIKDSLLCMKNNALKIEMMETFVNEFEEKSSEALKHKLDLEDATQETSIDDNSLRNNSNRLQLLINMLKERGDMQNNYETQIGQMKDENNRITKVLEEQSIALTELNESFEQLVQEKDLLAEKVNENQLNSEAYESSESELSMESHESGTIVCNNCKDLLIEREELKLAIVTINNDSAELKNKCRQLKEHLVQLKRQEEDTECDITNVISQEGPSGSFSETDQNSSVTSDETICDNKNDIQNKITNVEAPIQLEQSQVQKGQPNGSKTSEDIFSNMVPDDIKEENQETIENGTPTEEDLSQEKVEMRSKENNDEKFDPNQEEYNEIKVDRSENGEKLVEDDNEDESKVIEEIFSELDSAITLEENDIKETHPLDMDGLTQENRDDLILQIKDFKLEVESLNEANKGLKETILSLNENIAQIKEEYDRERSEIKVEFINQEQELDVLNKEKEERMNLISNLRSKIDELKSISHRMKENPITDKQPNDDQEKGESIKLHKMLEERSSSLKDLNEKLGVSKNFMQRILDENTDLKEQITENEIHHKELKKELEVLRTEIDLKKTVLDEVKEEKSQLDSKRSRLEEELMSVKEQLKARGSLLTTLEKEKEAFKGSLREAQQENASLRKQHELLQELLDSGKQRQKDTEELVKKLKQSCDEMTENFERASNEKKEIQDLLNDELKTERRKSNDFQDKVVILDKNQSSTEKTLAEYKEKIQTLNRELRIDKSRKEREIGNIMQENTRLLADEARLQNELEHVRDQLEYERTKNEKLEEDLKSAIIHNLTLNNSLKVQSEEKDKTHKDLEGNKKESKRLNTLTGDLKSKIANLDALLKATKDEKKFFSDEAEKNKMINADLRIRLKETTEDKEELEDMLVEMRDKRQKLHSEIDKALTERDELEDTLFDLRKETSKKLQKAAEQQKITEIALENAVKNENVLLDEIKQYKQDNSLIIEQNNNLKDDLEKTRTDLIQLLQNSSKDESNDFNYIDRQTLEKKLQDSENEVKRLTSLIEKQQQQAAENQNKQQVEELVQKVAVVPVVETELHSFFDELTNETNDRKEEVEKCNNENKNLQNELRQSETKVALLKQEIHNYSKKQVQNDFKYEAMKLKCSTLEDDLHKSNSQLFRARSSLIASNASVSDLRRHLQAAQDECKKAKQEKGIVEKVKITSIEVPQKSQVSGPDKDVPIAKAESLKSARKEIVILEAQVQDMCEKAKNDQMAIEKLLSQINNELTRARALIEKRSRGNISKTILPQQNENLSFEKLHTKVLDLKKDVDALENNVCKNKDSIDAPMSREDASLFDKLGTVISENHKLRDKLKFLEDSLNAILEEKQVLEDIGSSTRKELRSLVKSLSTEREEMKSINTEHSQLKSLLADAEKRIEDLTLTVQSLERDRVDNSAGIVPDIIVKQDASIVLESNPTQQENDLQEESKHLEMELMEQDRELQWLRKESDEVKVARDKLQNRCKNLESEKNSIEFTVKKLESQIQDLLAESKRKEKYLVSYREDNERLLTIQKTSEAQIRHLNREIELLSDRLVSCEAEKDHVLDANRQQQSEMQELFLQHAKDNVVREKLEKLFYENTKVKEQKKMLSTRLQTLEKDMKSQILAARDLEAEREESLIKIDKLLSEKRNEISKKERLAYLLDKQERESRGKLDSLTQLVEKLKQDKDELCSKNPRLHKIHQENNDLSKECAYKETVIAKLHEQNHYLKKEIDTLRKSYDKLKESQKMLSPNYEVKDGSLERDGSYRLSPHFSRKSGSKNSSFSSIDRPSPASSRGSFSSGRNDSRHRSTPVRRSSSRRSDDRSPGDGGDLSGGSSQECFCSPILSAVSLRPFEALQTDDRTGVCPVCKKRTNRKPMIKEHYV